MTHGFLHPFAFPAAKMCAPLMLQCPGKGNLMTKISESYQSGRGCPFQCAFCPHPSCLNPLEGHAVLRLPIASWFSRCGIKSHSIQLPHYADHPREFTQTLLPGRSDLSIVSCLSACLPWSLDAKRSFTLNSLDMASRLIPVILAKRHTGICWTRKLVLPCDSII